MNKPSPWSALNRPNPAADDADVHRQADIQIEPDQSGFLSFNLSAHSPAREPAARGSRFGDNGLQPSVSLNPLLDTAPAAEVSTASAAVSEQQPGTAAAETAAPSAFGLRFGSRATAPAVSLNPILTATPAEENRQTEAGDSQAAPEGSTAAQPVGRQLEQLIAAVSDLARHEREESPYLSRLQSTRPNESVTPRTAAAAPARDNEHAQHVLHVNHLFDEPPAPPLPDELPAAELLAEINNVVGTNAPAETEVPPVAPQTAAVDEAAAAAQAAAIPFPFGAKSPGTPLPDEPAPADMVEEIRHILEEDGEAVAVPAQAETGEDEQLVWDAPLREEETATAESDGFQTESVSRTESAAETLPPLRRTVPSFPGLAERLRAVSADDAAETDSPLPQTVSIEQNDDAHIIEHPPLSDGLSNTLPADETENDGYQQAEALWGLDSEEHNEPAAAASPSDDELWKMMQRPERFEPDDEPAAAPSHAAQAKAEPTVEALWGLEEPAADAAAHGTVYRPEEHRRIPHTEAAPPVSPHNRRRGLFGATAVFALIGLGFGAAYILLWQHEEHTDDAYVAGHLIQITPQIGGTVRQVAVDDTNVVSKGDILATLDDSDYQLAYEQAQNTLVQAIRGNRQQVAVTAQSRAEVLMRQAELEKARTALKRRESLLGTDSVSGEEISLARAAVAQAQAALLAVEAADTAANAAIGGSKVPVREQPAVQMAVNQVKSAWLNLQRTTIRAPADGQIAKRSVQVGQQVGAGMPLMAVVPLDSLWVDANFKEVQLSKLRIGQPVTLTSDFYGKKVVYHGKVVGLSAGTGSAFSLLPAQNATGNWIKVVQRVPVRISLDEKELKQYPLRVGLSMSVKVDTTNENGQSIAAKQANQTAPQTDAVDWTPVETVINDLFARYGH